MKPLTLTVTLNRNHQGILLHMQYMYGIQLLTFRFSLRFFVQVIILPFTIFVIHKFQGSPSE